jgi:undecaprenyl-diphosphatase
MDYAIVAILNGLAFRSEFFVGLAIFLAAHLIWFMFLAVAAFWIFSLKRRALAAVSAAVSAALAWLLNQGIGLIYFQPRPFADHADIHALIVKSSLEKSFPSDHAALAFALAVSVTLVNRRWGAWLIAAAILVAVGRVIVGVHYPSDVLAGCLVGCLVAYAVHRLIHHILRTRHHPHD